MGNIKANDTKWIGQKFGKLTVQGIVYKNSRYMWDCLCDCGNRTIAYPNLLIRGEQTACHCGKSKTFHDMHLKHGESGTRLHEIWCSMRKRCNNPNAKHYDRYGGRGIKVCDEWNSYINFATWARNNGYADDLSIDRINNDGNYEPSNCRWANDTSQARNRSSNIKIEIDGETHTLQEWCDIKGLKYHSVYSRIERGASAIDSLY